MTAAKERAIDIIKKMPDDNKMLEVVQILESLLILSEPDDSSVSDSIQAYNNFMALRKKAPDNFDFDYDRVKLEAMESKYGSVS